MKRTPLTLLGATALAAALGLSACSGDGDGGSGAESYQIGITQIVEHPSLDAAREGFKQAFADAGLEVTYDEQNAQGDQATATSIATTFAGDDLDLILAIATPTAQATAQAITDVPIMITAVTDPVEAGLVESWEAPGANISGTSDINPVDEQLSLLGDLAPDAQSVGIVYSAGEVNSQIQVDLAREAADELGLEIQEATVTNSSEVQQAAESLDVDAYYVPTDNTVVSGLEALLQVAESRSLPVIAADGASVERGALGTYGLDYERLGYQTGEMAVQVLTEDADPAEMPIETLSELSLILNSGAAERIGLELPAELVETADNVYE